VAIDRTGDGYSVNQILAAAEAAVGCPIPIQRQPRRPGDPPRLVAAPLRAMETLGWKPVHSSIENILETAWAGQQRCTIKRRMELPTLLTRLGQLVDSDLGGVLVTVDPSSRAKIEITLELSDAAAALVHEIGAMNPNSQEFVASFLIDRYVYRVYRREVEKADPGWVRFEWRLGRYAEFEQLKLQMQERRGWTSERAEQMRLWPQETLPQEGWPVIDILTEVGELSPDPLRCLLKLMSPSAKVGINWEEINDPAPLDLLWQKAAVLEGDEREEILRMLWHRHHDFWNEEIIRDSALPRVHRG